MEGRSDRVVAAGAVEAAVELALSHVDLPDGVALLTGATFWRTGELAVAGLRPVRFSDGSAGVRGETWDTESPSVCFPSPAALGTTWDAELVGRLAAEVAVEARAKGVDVVLAPTVNLQRSPLAGRHFEYLSEDPLLVGRLAAAYVESLQRHGVAATAKHYLANDAETHRFSVDVRIDEQTLREVYLAPFEQLVRSAGVWAVMASYNGVNGATMTENPLLSSPLIREWGFDGVLVSDWYATRSTEAAARGALTLVMPGPDGPWGEALVDAVRGGRVPEAAVTDKVRRLLRLAARVGALGSPGQPETPPVEAPTPRRVRPDLGPLLREAAAASIVLVQNDGELPLDPTALRRVAVVGPNAADLAIQGGGSCEVVSLPAVSVLEALRAGLGPEIAIEHEVGAYLRDGLVPVPEQLSHCRACGRPGVHVSYLDAAGRLLSSRHRPDGRLVWFGDQLPPDATVELGTRIRVDVAGTWRLGAIGVGLVRLTVDGSVVLEEVLRPVRAGFAGSFLDPPQGWVEFDLAAGQEVDVVLRHHPEHDVDLVKAALGLRAPRVDPEEAIERAVAAAGAADLSVVVVGTNEELETEGRDRTTLTLPGRQDELVRRVAAMSARTVVVVISGAPVSLPWRDEVSALVLAPFAGQEQGPGLADVLLGMVEPGGRLATTWPDETGSLVRSTRPVSRVMTYEERSDLGHRAWLRTGREPAYWFGHGLGYTSWGYEHLDVPETTPPDLDVVVRVRLVNTGVRRGKEVVQVYLSRSRSAVTRPVAWLAGFAVVHADPGEVVDVEVRLAARTIQHWSVADQDWRTEAGEFTVSAGRSAGDRPLVAQVRVGPGQDG